MLLLLLAVAVADEPSEEAAAVWESMATKIAESREAEVLPCEAPDCGEAKETSEDVAEEIEDTDGDE